MANHEKWVQVVTKLTRLTLENKITWGRIEPPSNITMGKGESIGAFFATVFRDRNIGIYEERYKAYYEDVDEFYWTSRNIIGFFSFNWELDWQLPQVAGIDELMEAVRYQVSGAGTIADEILKEDTGENTDNDS